MRKDREEEKRKIKKIKRVVSFVNRKNILQTE